MNKVTCKQEPSDLLSQFMSNLWNYLQYRTTCTGIFKISLTQLKRSNGQLKCSRSSNSQASEHSYFYQGGLPKYRVKKSQNVEWGNFVIDTVSWSRSLQNKAYQKTTHSVENNPRYIMHPINLVKNTHGLKNTRLTLSKTRTLILVSSSIAIQLVIGRI